MLTHYAIPELQRQNPLSEVIWMQNGSALHLEFSVNHLLSQQVGNRVISLHFPFLWPPRSPNLPPSDFWPWGYVKFEVHQFHSQTIPYLRDIIRSKHSITKKWVLPFKILEIFSL